jgi:hypothetical protein
MLPEYTLSLATDRRLVSYAKALISMTYKLARKIMLKYPVYRIFILRSAKTDNNAQQ